MARDDVDPDPVLMALGARIRDVRSELKLTRRALATQAGMSERYLAEIENGSGNVSIARLGQVAAALEMDLRSLFEPHDPLTEQVRNATPEERARVVEALTPRDDNGGRIALIGLRGAGKSTLGALAAARLGIEFHELNDEIAAETGLSVTELFDLYGQEGYRRLERAAVERLASGPAIVVAVAGGIVSEPETFALLMRAFRTIWLRARPEEHMNRVRAQGDERPMADNPQAMKDLRTILTKRENAYARADHVVDTSGRTVPQSLSDLLQAIGRQPGH